MTLASNPSMLDLEKAHLLLTTWSGHLQGHFYTFMDNIRDRDVVDIVTQNSLQVIALFCMI